MCGKPELTDWERHVRAVAKERGDTGRSPSLQTLIKARQTWPPSQDK